MTMVVIAVMVVVLMTPPMGEVGGRVVFREVILWEAQVGENCCTGAMGERGGSVWRRGGSAAAAAWDGVQKRL